MKRMQEPLTFKPIGLALAAVVAGAAPAAAATPAIEAPRHAAPPAAATAEPDDETLILGPSAPVEPFSTPAKPGKGPAQGSLFDL